MKKYFAALALMIPTAVVLGSSAAADETPNKKSIERGRYLTVVGGCNDCHTDGYAQSAGNIPESERLMGSAVGFNGPWGTTYPKNLRLLVQSMSETQWLAHARVERRPPMPWFNLREMKDDDLRALYQYVKSLGAKGNPAPEYVPPAQTVSTPYIEFFPKNLPAQAAR